VPQSIWNQVRRGKQVYWRVRGVDLNHEPLTFINSAEVWSFKKQ
jgi:hypothetical protein